MNNNVTSLLPSAEGGAPLAAEPQANPFLAASSYTRMQLAEWLHGEPAWSKVLEKAKSDLKLEGTPEALTEFHQSDQRARMLRDLEAAVADAHCLAACPLPATFDQQMAQLTKVRLWKLLQNCGPKAAEMLPVIAHVLKLRDQELDLLKFAKDQAAADAEHRPMNAGIRPETLAKVQEALRLC